MFEFETAFAKYQGRRDAILFNSGGSANLAMLQALKNLGRLKDGDRIGFSALTWSTNVMPIIQMGFRPVAIDCDPATLNVMSHNLEERLAATSLEGLFITNALGFTGDLGRIKSICDDRGILLLEITASRSGPSCRKAARAILALPQAFRSLWPIHMSTIEGGVATTDDGDLSEMLRIVRANGWDRNLRAEQQLKWRKAYDVRNEFEAKYTFYDLGFNLRPTEITGFLGLCQLRHLAGNVARRQANYLLLESAALQNPDLVPWNARI